jgi:hypothetical protein
MTSASNAVLQDYMELLERLSDEAARQQQAILDRQTPALNSSTLRLMRLMTEFKEIEARCPDAAHPLAAQVRRRLALNRTLLRNGMMTVDRLFAGMASGAVATAALLSERA